MQTTYSKLMAARAAFQAGEMSEAELVDAILGYRPMPRADAERQARAYRTGTDQSEPRCDRCGGTGQYGQHGVCFDCGGSGR